MPRSECDLGMAAWQIGVQVSQVGAEASLRSTSVGFGGEYARLRTDCRMVGRGATGELDAVYFAGHRVRRGCSAERERLPPGR